MNRLLLTVISAVILMPGLAFGDLVVAGRINNATTDSFTFFALRDLVAGEEFYFTDNGWINASGSFRGASTTDGDGNENLIKFKADAAITAGTLINSTVANPGVWTWTTSGLVPGATTGNFANLSLSQTGDQIYAFAGPTNLPLFTPGTIHFVLDDTNGFEDATSASTGNLPSGVTGISFSPTTLAGTLRLNNDGQARTATQWQAYATNPLNWTSGASSGAGSIDLNVGNFSVVPEPTALVMVGMAVLGGLVRCRRNG